MSQPPVPTPTRANGNTTWCRYPNGKCTQPRALKRNGDLHSLCEMHRLRACQNQRRSDQKKRLSMQERKHSLKEQQVTPNLDVSYPSTYYQEHPHCIFHAAQNFPYMPSTTPNECDPALVSRSRSYSSPVLVTKPGELRTPSCGYLGMSMNSSLNVPESLPTPPVMETGGTQPIIRSFSNPFLHLYSEDVHSLTTHASNSLEDARYRSFSDVELHFLRSCFSSSEENQFSQAPLSERLPEPHWALPTVGSQYPKHNLEDDIFGLDLKDLLLNP